MKAYLEPMEIVRLEKAAICTRDRLLIRILSRLGCRVSEAIALTIDDIDLHEGRITIKHLKSRIRITCPECKSRLAKAHTYCPGCGNRVEQAVMKAQEYHRVRSIPLDDETLDILEYFIRHGGPVYRYGKLLLFSINRHRAWQVVRDCAERAGLPDLVNTETGKVHGVSPHRLRDAFAVMAVRKDDSTDGIRMLQEQLGHANIGTTMRYRKVAGQELKDWYSRLWEEESSD